MLASFCSLVVIRPECVMGLQPTQVDETPVVHQPIFMEGSPSPLSSREQPRDLQFSGPFLEMFSTKRIAVEGPAVTTFALLRPRSLGRSGLKRVRAFALALRSHIRRGW